MSLIILLLLLAAPGRSIPTSAQVESPTGKPLVEDSADPLALEWRARHCAERGEKAKRYRSENAAFELLPCLSHPDPSVRWHTLSALNNSDYFRRPDFDKVILPKLRLAVEYSSKDQDPAVRSTAGDLSRSIEQWQNFDSPQAKARREQFRKDERKRFWLSLLRPDAELAEVYLGSLLILSLLLAGVRLR